MTVSEIIKKYLLDNGFDGLVSDVECGCPIDDLAQCESEIMDCIPAYRWSCDGCIDRVDCECDACMDGGHCFRTDRQFYEKTDNSVKLSVSGPDNVGMTNERLHYTRV
jgi:hypothetical protein